ncbi:BnaA09g44770D [Brassica napus]|uniref:threonine--tRNA ligase n=1 Tax=Brassica napus TaxID=3708 RepID=A0A078G8L2_BRANA|nr:unnamed protein product [Brassica napus]CDY21726.1 BnaA09g44770D [Brassica napus]
MADNHPEDEPSLSVVIQNTSSVKQDDLFLCQKMSPGSCFLLPHGTRVYNKLIEFIKKEYWKRGYEEVISPNIYNMKLWETSKDAASYKENLFTFDIDKQEFGLKSINGPGHCLMFEHRVRSYRELPIRLAEFGVLHLNEASEALSGLTHTRRFQQDDAHIFCTKEQVKKEVKDVLDFVDYVYTKFGFTYELKLLTRPEENTKDLQRWEESENDLVEALQEFGKPFTVVNRGEGALCGPKIDITLSDAMKRKFQCASIQLDFQLPDHFKLRYSPSDEEKKENVMIHSKVLGSEDKEKGVRPVMIHRTVLGSFERMLAILLDHYKGKWPFWISPRQVIVCSSSNNENHRSYAEEVRRQIHEAGYHVEVDTTDRNISEKVGEAEIAQYNYILVVGDEEVATRQVTALLRDSSCSDRSKVPMMSVDALLDVFKLRIVKFL